MCILFLYAANIGGSDSPKEGKPYKLILASNRDEKFSRPSASAKFWEESDGTDSHILAGQDLEELGTWLGISKRGKLAILLNIMGKSSASPNSNSNHSLEEPTATIQMRSRGALVTGFLRSPRDLPGCTYLKNLCQDPEDLDISRVYNPFHLITVDLIAPESIHAGSSNAGAIWTEEATQRNSRLKENSHICVTYLSNKTTDSIQPLCLTPPLGDFQYYALGNSVIDKPFRKVACGRELFQYILNEHIANKGLGGNNCEDEDILVEKLLNFLKYEDRYFPDAIMENQAKEANASVLQMVPHLSSIFVNLSPYGISYGTRTHTILLVDVDNNVTFHEWTMKDPIDPMKPVWSHVKNTFQIESE